MPNLNKRQIEFRKQMQELQNVKTYKEIMNDHDSFYNNKAYERELEELKEKRIRANKKFILFLIIFSIIIAAYCNQDFIKSKLIAFKNNSINESVLKLSNNNIITSNDKKQFKVGEYHKYFTKRIENLFLIMKTDLAFNDTINFDINKINKQINVIDDMIIEFSNYIPEEINKNLHTYNINVLHSLKEKYKAAEALTVKPNDIILTNNFNTANNNINLWSQSYRNELLKIFDEINMNYSYLENNSITFSYTEIQ